MAPIIETPSLAQPSHNPVETLCPTACVEWLCGGRIVCYTASGAARETYRILFDRAEQITHDWPADQPYMVVIDMVTGNAGVTPYSRERGRALARLRPDLTTMMSLVMPRSVQASLTQITMRAFQNKSRAIAVHFARGEAIAWLKKLGHLG